MEQKKRRRKVRTPRLANRAEHEGTIEEFGRNLRSLFPDGVAQALSAADAEKALTNRDHPRIDKKAVWDSGGRTLTVPLVHPGTATLSGAVQLRFSRELDENDLGVADAFTAVFNLDLAVAPEFHLHQELWLSLQQTRFSRVIGRYTSLSTDTFVRQLRIFENAGSLRYEGEPFTTSLIITSKVSLISSSSGVDYVKFSNHINLAKAIYDEKWIRALSAGGDVVLVAYSTDNKVVGAARIDETSRSTGLLIPPHERLAGLCSALCLGTMALVNSPSGDLFALFPDGAIFSKSQGKWIYLNYRVLAKALLESLSDQAAAAVMRLVLDLSYDKRGALIVIPDQENLIPEMVPDHGSGMVTNRELRLFAKKLDITARQHRMILQSVAAIDGAVLISKSGAVLDASCMIVPPTDDKLSTLGLVRRTFPGARTTAAWSGSIYGTSVKVSEDGPITIFKSGKQVFQIG